MKKQKIKADNLYRSPLRETTFRAVGTEDFKDAVSRFLKENYEGAFELSTVGTFRGFVHLIPSRAAAFLTSVFRTVCLSSLIQIAIEGDNSTMKVALSFPQSVEIERETAREWIYLSESSGFTVRTKTENGKIVLNLSVRVTVFTAEVRATTALTDFYEALKEASGNAKA